MSFSHLNIMMPTIPDVKRTTFGISSPRSSIEGYSCAYPSWPNRPWLDGRVHEREAMPHRHTMPTPEFLESLRRCPRPEDCIIDDSDEEGEEVEVKAEDEPAIAASLASNTSSTNFTPPKRLQKSNACRPPITSSTTTTTTTTITLAGSSTTSNGTAAARQTAGRSYSLLSRAFSRIAMRQSG